MNTTSRIAWGFWATAALFTALAVGFLDAALALAKDSAGAKSAAALISSTALVAAGTLAGFAAAALALILLRKTTGILPNDRRVAVWLSATTLSFYVFVWSAGLNEVSNVKASPGFSLVLMAIGAVVAVMAGVGVAHAAFRGQSATNPGAATSSLASVIPATLLLMAFLTVLSYGGIYATRSEPLRPVAFVDPGPEQHTGPIILITIDTLRRDSLTRYNPDGAGTPNLDALAADSTVIENAYTPGPWTIPSMVSIMTGVSADVHGISENFAAIPPQYKTAAEHISDAGYATVAVGSQPQLLRMNRGFREFHFWPKRLPFHGDSTGGKLLWRLLDDSMHSERKLTETAIQWLQETGSNRFFLWVHYKEPHIPYEPPREYIKGADDLVEKFGAKFDGMHSAVRTGRIIQTDAERRWLKALYDAEVRFVDHEVGRILDTLREQGLYDDAIVAFTTDHGEEFWEHGNWEHGHSLYNELVGAPLFIKLPGQSTAGRSVPGPAGSSALLPTLLDLAGIDYDEASMTERSFARLIRGEDDGLRPTLYLSGTEYFDPREAVVFGSHKYVRRLDGTAHELYALDTDPGELRNIAESNGTLIEKAAALLNERAAFRETFRRALGISANGEDEELDKNVQEELEALGYL